MLVKRPDLELFVITPEPHQILLITQRRTSLKDSPYILRSTLNYWCPHVNASITTVATSAEGGEEPKMSSGDSPLPSSPSVPTESAGPTSTW
jgi:hypothetical protein